MSTDYFSLISQIYQNLQGIVLLYKSSGHGMSELKKNTEWFNPSEDRYENKDRMKELGGSLTLAKWHMQETVILFLARTIEDVIFGLEEMKGLKVNIWKLDPKDYVYLSEAQEIRHLSNVIRHNSGHILKGAGDSSNKLISDFGYSDQARVGQIKFDIDQKLFHVYCFCVELASKSYSKTCKLPKDGHGFLESLFPSYFSFDK